MFCVGIVFGEIFVGCTIEYVFLDGEADVSVGISVVQRCNGGYRFLRCFCDGNGMFSGFDRCCR